MSGGSRSPVLCVQTRFEAGRGGEARRPRLVWLICEHFLLRALHCKQGAPGRGVQAVPRATQVPQRLSRGVLVAETTVKGWAIRVFEEDCAG